MLTVSVSLATMGVVAGCDDGNNGFTQTPQNNFVGAYQNTNSDGTKEYVLLKRDGTYEQAMVDRYRNVYRNEGTWQKYGNSNKKTRVGGSQVELRGWADPLETSSNGSTQNIPRIKKTLPGGAFLKP